jgi:hypothetical protein
VETSATGVESASTAMKSATAPVKSAASPVTTAALGKDGPRQANERHERDNHAENP